MGLSASAARAEDEDDDLHEDAAAAEGDDEDDVDDADPAKARKAKKAKAEDDDDDTTDQVDAEDGDDDQDDKPASKKSAKAEDDEDDKETAKAARTAERSRWATVMGSRAAAGRVASACSMLANSSMSASAIITTLKTLPAQSGRTGLADRMASAPIPSVGADAGGGAESKPTLAAQIVAAAKKARGA
jgi:hypothetical protein